MSIGLVASLVVTAFVAVFCARLDKPDILHEFILFASAATSAFMGMRLGQHIHDNKKNGSE